MDLCISRFSKLLILSQLLWIPFSFAEEKKSIFSLTGYLDGSYNYLASDNQFISGVYDRAFDLNENGFTLQQAALTASLLPERGLGASINVIFGRDPYITAAYGTDPYIGMYEIGFDLTQAWLQYRFSDKFYVALGKFVTLAGAETIDPTNDFNFSRSELFTFAIPFAVTGFRAYCTLSSKWKATLGIIEGWDTIKDENESPTAELGLYYTPSDKINYSLVGYMGHEQVIPRTDLGPIATRSVVDAIISYKAHKKTTLTVNYDYGRQNDSSAAVPGTNEAVWQGIAGYILQDLNTKWSFCVRGEVFEDRNGYRTGDAQTLKEATLTLIYKPRKNIILRAETRRDTSNNYTFVSKETGNVRDFQQSYAIEGILTFAKEFPITSEKCKMGKA